MVERVQYQDTSFDGYLARLRANYNDNGGEMPKNVEVHSFKDPEARSKAVEDIKLGKVVAVYNGGVWALFWDGANPQATEIMYDIKGRDRSKPSGAAVDLDTFITDMVDRSQIPENLQDYFLKPDKLRKLIGSFSFLRMPIKKEAKDRVPSHMVSTEVIRTDPENPDSPTQEVYYFQNWSSYGIPSTTRFLNELREAGVTMVAVTSMNQSGTGELIYDQQGIDFASEKGIPDVYIDPSFFANPNNLSRSATEGALDPDAQGLNRGSYSILQVDRKGMTIKREGTFGRELYQAVLSEVLTQTNTSLGTEGMRVLEGRQHRIPKELYEPQNGEVLTPDIIHTSIMAYANGRSTEDILAWRRRKLTADAETQAELERVRQNMRQN